MCCGTPRSAWHSSAGCRQNHPGRSWQKTFWDVVKTSPGGLGKKHPVVRSTKRIRSSSDEHGGHHPIDLLLLQLVEVLHSGDRLAALVRGVERLRSVHRLLEGARLVLVLALVLAVMVIVLVLALVLAVV